MVKSNLRQSMMFCLSLLEYYRYFRGLYLVLVCLLSATSLSIFFIFLLYLNYFNLPYSDLYSIKYLQIPVYVSNFSN